MIISILLSAIAMAANCPNEHSEAVIIAATKSTIKDTKKKCCVPTTVDWETYEYAGNCEFIVNPVKKAAKDALLAQERSALIKRKEDIEAAKVKAATTKTDEDLLEYLKLKEGL